jgi:hypothetical protein
VHFPDGSKEFRYPSHRLERDDVVAYNGQRYRVASVSSDGDRESVVVELDSDELKDLLQSERGAIELELV